jgi:hypothetical protein
MVRICAERCVQQRAASARDLSARFSVLHFLDRKIDLDTESVGWIDL